MCVRPTLRTCQLLGMRARGIVRYLALISARLLCTHLLTLHGPNSGAIKLAAYSLAFSPLPEFVGTPLTVLGIPSEFGFIYSFRSHFTAQCSLNNCTFVARIFLLVVLSCHYDQDVRNGTIIVLCVRLPGKGWTS